MALHSSRGDTRTNSLDGAIDTFRAFTWLEDDRRPLDWNGPATRLFTRFRNQDLQRPIIEHFERVARRQRHRIAIRESDTALTFGELCDGVSRLAETLAAETKPGDLIASGCCGMNHVCAPRYRVSSSKPVFSRGRGTAETTPSLSHCNVHVTNSSRRGDDEHEEEGTPQSIASHGRTSWRRQLFAL